MGKNKYRYSKLNMLQTGILADIDLIVSWPGTGFERFNNTKTEKVNGL